MMNMIPIALSIVIGIAVLFFALSWIIPLIVGIVWRRRKRPGARGWIIFGSVWGAAVILLAAGAATLAILVSRSFDGSQVGGHSEASPFDPGAYKGKTGTVRTPFQGESRLTATCAENGNMSMIFAGTNGTFTVPAGHVVIQSYEATTQDAAGHKWTARVCELRDDCEIDVTPGGVCEVRLGPPFKAAVEMTWSALSDKIQISPVYVDNDGNQYRISAAMSGSLPQFQFLGDSNRVVWSGKFVAS
jgi:hypothetical protein